MQAIGILHIIFLSLLPFTTAPTKAQSPGTKAIYQIEFKAGAKTAVVEGTVAPPVTVGPDMTNDGVVRYSLRVSAGQYFSMELSSNNQKAMFSLVKPSPGGSENEIVKKASGVNHWSGRLKNPGNYLITVFTRGKEASHFKLRVALH